MCLITSIDVCTVYTYVCYTKARQILLNSRTVLLRTYSFSVILVGHTLNDQFIEWVWVQMSETERAVTFRTLKVQSINKSAVESASVWVHYSTVYIDGKPTVEENFHVDPC